MPRSYPGIIPPNHIPTPQHRDSESHVHPAPSAHPKYILSCPNFPITLHAAHPGPTPPMFETDLFLSAACLLTLLYIFLLRSTTQRRDKKTSHRANQRCPPAPPATSPPTNTSQKTSTAPSKANTRHRDHRRKTRRTRRGRKSGAETCTARTLL